MVSCGHLLAPTAQAVRSVGANNLGDLAALILLMKLRQGRFCNLSLTKDRS